MTRTIAFLLAATAAMVMASGCSDDGGSGPGPQPDTGGITLDHGGSGNEGGTNPDTGGGNPDAALTNLSCVQIASCYSKCTDATCGKACIASGTTSAQSTFNAYVTCIDTSQKGTCATDCTDPKAQKCGDCINKACAKEKTACTGGGGPPMDGFGESCTGTCKTGLSCMTMGGSNGFCTKTCTNKLGPCTGPPTGSYAACIMPDSAGTTYSCAFICKTKTKTYKCPSTMKCATKDNPPNSGQYLCEP